MDEKDLKPSEQGQPANEPEIVVNQYGRTKDPTVVVEEKDRTVMLTPDETIIIDKEPSIDIVPKTRPRHVYGGMWGRNEIVTVGFGVFAFLIIALIYFFLVIPSNRELALHQSELDNLKAIQATAETRYGDVTNTQTKVDELISSEKNFETQYLPPMGSGRNALYQRLNGLIDAYGLTNTSGPDYAPLDVATQDNGGNQSDEQRGREKFRSLFPGVYVSMTVEGSYQNLRRFIKEIETGNEFIVISSVQLTPSDSEKQTQGDQSKPVQAPPTVAGPPNTYARPNMSAGPPIAMRPSAPAPVVDTEARGQKGKTHGEVVSLHLEMAAYFRLPDPDATTAQ